MTGQDTSAPTNEASDELLRALGELRDRPRSPPPRAHAVARAAFVRSFEPVRWYEPALTLISRTSLPVALGCIVLVYLTWAFSTASALMQ